MSRPTRVCSEKDQLGFEYETFTLYGSFFPKRFFYHLIFPIRYTPQPPNQKWLRFRLFRFRSPLLTESLLISFPLGTEMFQFPRLASCLARLRRSAGFPHSETPGSQLNNSSPSLIAVIHVLHRSYGAKASIVCS